MYKKKSLYRHAKKCTKKKNPQKRVQHQRAGASLMPILGNVWVTIYWRAHNNALWGDNEDLPNFTDLEWRKHFRISRDTFEYLAEELRPSLDIISPTGRPRLIGYTKTACCCFVVVSNTHRIQVIGHTFWDRNFKPVLSNPRSMSRYKRYFVWTVHIVTLRKSPWRDNTGI